MDPEMSRRLLSLSLGLLFLLSSSGIAQEDNCPSDVRPEDVSEIRTRVAQGMYVPPITPFDIVAAPLKVPVTLHVVRRSDGSGGLTPDRLVQALVDSNAVWASASIQFFKCGPTKFINSDFFYSDINSDNDIDDLLTTNPVPDTINIYFTSIVRNDSGSICGRGSFTTSSIQGIVVQNACAGLPSNPSTVPHEIGHYLDLYHTHTTTFGEECADGSNGGSTGDLLSDTPADPKLDSNASSPGYNVNSSCTYFGSEADPCGDQYAPDTTNVMSYSRKQCRDTFSLQQRLKARATLLNLRPEHFGGCVGINSFLGGSNKAPQTPGIPLHFARRDCDASEDTCQQDSAEGGSTDDFITALIQVKNRSTSPFIGNIIIEADRSALGSSTGPLDATRFFRPIGGGPRLTNPMTFAPGNTNLLLEIPTVIKDNLVSRFPINLPFSVRIQDTADGGTMDYSTHMIGLRPAAGYYDDDVVAGYDLPQDPVVTGDAVVVKFDASDLPGPGASSLLTGIQLVGSKVGGTGTTGLSSIELRRANPSDMDEPNMTPAGLLRSAGPITFAPGGSTEYVDLTDLVFEPPMGGGPNLFVICYFNPGDSLGSSATALGFSDGEEGEVLVQNTSYLLAGQLPLLPELNRMAMVRLDFNGALAP